MKDDQIKGYFAFEDSDLLANRTGRLSEKQSSRIKKADQFAERFIVGLFLIFLASGIFLGVLAFSVRSNIGFWIGAVILFVLAGWAFRGTRVDMDDAVQKVQGEVNFIKVEKQTGATTDSSAKRMNVSSYEMCVGGEVFVVPIPH